MTARELALFLYANMERSKQFGFLDLYVMVDGKRLPVDKVVATEDVFVEKAGVVFEIKPE